MTQSMTRRSIAIDGNVTSIKLEPGFWRYVDHLATLDGVSWAEYVRDLLRGTQATATRASRLRERVLQAVAHHSVPVPGKSEFPLSGWQIRSGRALDTFSGHKPLLFIGRGRSCDIVLDDAECSRIHAAAFSVDRQWWIADLASKNGIWINRRRVKCQVLPKRTWVGLGRHGLRLLANDTVGARHE